MSAKTLPRCRCRHLPADHKVGYAYGEMRHLHCNSRGCRCVGYEAATAEPAPKPAAEMPTFDAVAEYPLLVCRTCRWAGALRELHTRCDGELVPGRVLILADGPA